MIFKLKLCLKISVYFSKLIQQLKSEKQVQPYFIQINKIDNKSVDLSLTRALLEP